MSAQLCIPVVGQWYRPSTSKGQLFEVISIDDLDSNIEIQFFDGNIDQLEMESWLEMDISPEYAPENWFGAIDVPELDDLGSSITDTSEDDWYMPFEEIVVNDDNILVIEQDVNLVSLREEQ
jgi:hypothetical protein